METVENEGDAETGHVVTHPRTAFLCSQEDVGKPRLFEFNHITSDVA